LFRVHSPSTQNKTEHGKSFDISMARTTKRKSCHSDQCLQILSFSAKDSPTVSSPTFCGGTGPPKSNRAPGERGAGNRLRKESDENYADLALPASDAGAP
jgi:hypothetical protein